MPFVARGEFLRSRLTHCGALRCSAVRPYIVRMNNDARFELRLPVQRRPQLEALADETGLSSADLARLAIGRLLANPEVILKFSQPTEA
jgi:hypothetical protein